MTPTKPKRRKPDQRAIAILAYDALSYAIGFCKGLGHPCHYAEKQSNLVSELLSRKRK